MNPESTFEPPVHARSRLRTLQSLGPQGGGHLAAEIRELAPWFHNLHLPDGTQTAPDHPLGDFPHFNWELLARHLPVDLHGWRVLDIGCNAGFYSFALAQRGAQVLGVDVDPHYLRQARWAAARMGLESSVRFEQRAVYDLARLDGSFDLVLFLGVFYHLRYPQLALELVAEKVERLLVFQSLAMPGDEVEERTSGYGIGDRAVFRRPGWPKMAFVEGEFAGDETNWWVPNRACVEALLRSVGMHPVARPASEFYVCEPAAGPRPAPAWHELRDALRGEPWSADDTEGSRGLA